MAMALAAANIARWPASEAAASAKAAMWQATSRGQIWTMGWIVGTVWLTFPTSVEPSSRSTGP